MFVNRAFVTKDRAYSTASEMGELFDAMLPHGPHRENLLKYMEAIDKVDHGIISEESLPQILGGQLHDGQQRPLDPIESPVSSVWVVPGTPSQERTVLQCVSNDKLDQQDFGNLTGNIPTGDRQPQWVEPG
eukprot:46266-Eustigmatos_ZCMA.PRE.1